VGDWRFIGIAAWLALGGLWYPQDANAAELWPAVLPVDLNVDFGDSKGAALVVDVFGRDGASQYRMECHTWEYDDPSRFVYSGDFECRLSPLRKPTSYSTLLTEDVSQSRDWESRGRFLADELQGACADYPEYGRVRHFRLRGMDIALSISNIVFTQVDIPSKPGVKRPGLQSFRVSIGVKPNADAKTAIAEAVAFPAPPYLHPGGDDFSRDCGELPPK
jgi:hypothetical protein